MVKSHAKQTPDEKKESRKKGSSSGASSNVKKKPDTGSWPCKMDGCKKIFAREADLKRHQRTTKTHSIPGYQCPQCDATFTRTDALRRHQKSRHNGVVIEPSGQDTSKHVGDGLSSGSRSPSPSGTPSRSMGEGSMNGSPPAGQSGSAGSSGRSSSYYRPHTMQDGYYVGYPSTPRPPPPGMMMDPHYAPPPIGLPTSATRGNWHPQPLAPAWVPEGHPLPPPPPGMYIPSYYPSPYYRHPGVHVPMPPQINPELLAQSNGHSNGVGPPESALRNTSAKSPKSHDGGADGKAFPSRTSSTNPAPEKEPKCGSAGPASHGAQTNGAANGPDESTLMAAAALQAVLAFQKEQQTREVEADTTQPPPDVSSTSDTDPPHPQPQTQEKTTRTGETETVRAPAAPDRSTSNAGIDTDTSQPQNDNVRVAHPADAGPSVEEAARAESPDLDAVGEPDQEMSVDEIVHAESGDSSIPSEPMEAVADEGTPMLNPEELLTQESLASPPPT